MPSDSAKLNYAMSYLRRTKTLAQLKALSDTVAAALLSGKTKVVITNTQMEGGGGSGEVEFEATLVGLACEKLIEQLEPASAATRPSLGVVIRDP